MMVVDDIDGTIFFYIVRSKIKEKSSHTMLYVVHICIFIETFQFKIQSLLQAKPNCTGQPFISFSSGII